MGQARVLFGRYEAVAALRALARRPGWFVRRNFHFGFMQRHYCCVRSEIEIGEYLSLWQQRISAGEGAIPRARWDEYWDDLVSLAIARPEDRAESDPHFTDTNRTSASPRPGCGSGATGRWRKPRRSTTRGAIAAATEERPSTTASRRSP